ncbi:hypothetical protein [Thermoleophilum album]|uniref:Uncharacterized protein n=1 Tax=Thermoleophilum album TaxID=29539 RepID=A0A1H6G205_THEAL|nr:hypothetical protein [Thermoleophilum album]SEH16313.1 hypothetical protein SAMN02745716_2140 [Thermoleophilum album]
MTADRKGTWHRTRIHLQPLDFIHEHIVLAAFDDLSLSAELVQVPSEEPSRP